MTPHKLHFDLFAALADLAAAHNEIARLAQENEILCAMVGATGTDALGAWRSGLQLSPQRALILRTLLRHEFCPREVLARLLHGGEQGRAKFQSIQTQITAIRQAIRPFGVEIENVRQRGWRIPDREGAQRKLLAGRGA